VGTHFSLVESPIDQSSAARWHHLATSRQSAHANLLSMTYEDASADMQTPPPVGLTSTLPCISIERSCGSNGTIMVSSPNGVHFCAYRTPSSPGVIGPCAVLRGTFRFAFAKATTVTQCVRPAPTLLV